MKCRVSESDMKALFQKYFRPALANIKVNNGEESVNDDTIQAVCRQILEEANIITIYYSIRFENLSSNENLKRLDFKILLHVGISLWGTHGVCCISCVVSVHHN